MKKYLNKWMPLRKVALGMLFLFMSGFMMGQEVDKKDSANKEPATKTARRKPVKNTFENIWLIDNQTVLVPIKGTFQMDIMHRFGTINNGYKDFYGMFASSNIRLGFNYVPIDKLLIGLSITKANMTWEGYAKYAIIKQTQGRGYPVSVTYYGDIAMDTREKDNFRYFSDRLMFFNQLLIARKINKKLSIQVAPNHTHVNFVEGYFSAPGKVSRAMYNDHFAVALSGRYKLKEAMGLMFNYDQPITKHKSNNPNPNLSFGLELTTSAHAFQIFIGNYSYITPQRNNYFNHNNFEKKQFLIGFNITRLWNY